MTSTALHTALIAALDEAVDCDVWDAVPPGADYPYVTVDTSEAANEDFLTDRMERRFVYLSVWSTHPGQAEVLSIMDQIDALHEQPLTLASGHAVSVRVERRRTSREPDNLTFMGQVTLRVFTTR